MTARLIAYRGHGTKKTLMERIFGSVEKRVLAVYGARSGLPSQQVDLGAALDSLLGGTLSCSQMVPSRSFQRRQQLYPRRHDRPAGASPTRCGACRHRRNVMRNYDAVDMTFSASGNGQFLQQNMAFMLAFLKDKKDRRIRLADPPTIDEVAGRMGASDGQIARRIGALQPQQFCKSASSRWHRPTFRIDAEIV